MTVVIARWATDHLTVAWLLRTRRTTDQSGIFVGRNATSMMGESAVRSRSTVAVARVDTMRRTGVRVMRRRRRGKLVLDVDIVVVLVPFLDGARVRVVDRVSDSIRAIVASRASDDLGLRNGRQNRDGDTSVQTLHLAGSGLIMIENATKTG